MGQPLVLIAGHVFTGDRCLVCGRDVLAINNVEMIVAAYKPTLIAI